MSPYANWLSIDFCFSGLGYDLTSPNNLVPSMHILLSAHCVNTFDFIKILVGELVGMDEKDKDYHHNYHYLSSGDDVFLSQTSFFFLFRKVDWMLSILHQNMQR